MMKLRHLAYLLLTLPLLLGCNNADDIDEIFISGTWNVGNFYNGGDWNKLNDGARPTFTKEEDIKALNALTVSFLKDGQLQGHIATGPFTGKWAADGDKRTISITNLKYSGNPTGKSKQLIDALKKATYYKGDSNYLKLAPEDKKSYVQLGHYSK